MTLTDAIRETLSEAPAAGGTLSWGRVASSVTFFAAIGWVSYLLIKTHILPALDGITAFALAPYGANKIATTIQSFSSGTNGANGAPPVR